MIGVIVAEEHDVEIDEPDLRAQQLPLRALAAIEQDAIAAAPDQRRRAVRAAVGVEPAVPRKTTSRSTRPSLGVSRRRARRPGRP